MSRYILTMSDTNIFESINVIDFRQYIKSDDDLIIPNFSKKEQDTFLQSSDIPMEDSNKFKK